MKSIVLLATLFLLSGCGMPHTSSDYTAFHTIDREIGPKKISITSFGTTRFKGLIAIAPFRNGLRFSLLDSMGVTLLKVQWEKGGNVTVLGGIPQITDSNLTELLAESLSRIYLLEPAESPCSKKLFTSFCHEKARGCQTVKYLRNGPFVSWKVCYMDDKRATIIYTRPLTGFTLTLADINIHNTQSHSGEL